MTAKLSLSPVPHLLPLTRAHTHTHTHMYARSTQHTARMAPTGTSGASHSRLAASSVDNVCLTVALVRRESPEPFRVSSPGSESRREEIKARRGPLPRFRAKQGRAPVPHDKRRGGVREKGAIDGPTSSGREWKRRYQTPADDPCGRLSRTRFPFPARSANPDASNGPEG